MIYGKKNSVALMRIANRVANIALPQAGNDVFNAIRRSQQNAEGSRWTDYRKELQGQMGLSGIVPSPLSTMTMAASQKKLGFKDDRNTLTAASGTGLPNLVSPPKRGIASAPKGTHGACNHAAGYCAEEYEEQGGSPTGYNGPDTMYVDDKRWPVTLAQILGSKMLTQEQLQKASIQNVSTMFKVKGGTSQDRAEMYYMFQRMMLEGFIRGVDITKDMSKQRSFDIEITPGTTVASNANNIGLSTQGGVKFNGKYWNKANDAEKMMLFYHEIGHELINKPHGDGGIMASGQGKSNAKKIQNSQSEYNRLMNQLFSQGRSREFSHLKTPVARNSNAQYDQSWYPGTTGAIDGYTPGGEGGNGGSMQPGGFYGDINVAPPAVTINNISPPTINTNAGANPTIQSGGGAGRATDIANTPTAPASQINTTGFASLLKEQDMQPLDQSGGELALRSGT